MIQVDFTGAMDHDEYEHEVLKISLKNTGEVYVLDMASAQYGYYQPVQAWEDWFKARVKHTILGEGSREFGWHREVLLEDARTDNGVLGATFRLHADATNFLKDLSTSWEENNSTISAMLRTNLDIYEARRTELLDFIRTGLDRIFELYRQKSERRKDELARGRQARA
jgi:hypothetical protein